jgi:hypothetical protein
VYLRLPVLCSHLNCSSLVGPWVVPWWLLAACAAGCTLRRLLFCLALLCPLLL